MDLSEVQLETERLIMRMWRNDDFEPYFEICSDPEVMRYLGGKTFDRLEAWRHLAFIVGHWQLRGYGHWAVEEKATGTLVGRVGFLNPEGWPAFELELDALAQVLGPRLRFGSRAPCLTYGFDELEKDHVISLIDPKNKNSIKVAERLGEKLEGKTELLGREVLIYGIDRPVNSRS